MRRGEDFVSPCRVDGAPISVPAPDPPDSVARSGEILAWVDAGGMHAAVPG